MTTTIRRALGAAAAAGILSVTTPGIAAAEPVWDEPAGLAGAFPAPPPPVIEEVVVDDGALEYVQVGLGVLAGVGVTAAAAVALRRRHEHAPHPA